MTTQADKKLPADEAVANQLPTASGTAPTPINPGDGSTLYYALLGCNASQRHRVCAWLRLFNTLSDTLVEVSDSGVAEQKIHWWHEEIERLCRGEPRHPDCVQLQVCQPQSPALQSAEGQTARLDHPLAQQSNLMKILAANNNEKFVNASDQSSFEKRLLDDYQSRLQILLCVLCPPTDNISDSEQQQWLNELALGLGLFDRLRLSHRLYHNGYPVWPDSTYSQFKLSPEELGLADSSEQTTELFQTVVNEALNHLKQALQLAEASSTLGRDCAPLLIYAALRHKQLSVWKKKQINPLQHYLALTPLNKAWSNWRQRRRFNIPA